MASFIVALLGAVLLAASLLPAVTPREAGVVTNWHSSSHPAGTITVPGLALHPGRDVAVLALNLTPAAEPASILSVALPPLATETPGGDAAPGAETPARNP